MWLLLKHGNGVGDWACSMGLSGAVRGARVHFVSITGWKWGLDSIGSLWTWGGGQEYGMRIHMVVLVSP